jgi:hypothetical protein
VKLLLTLAVIALVIAWARGRNQRLNAMGVGEARRVLALAPGADAAAVQEAHRRIIARVHPDSGGTDELARRVNVARDTLLADLERRRIGKG